MIRKLKHSFGTEFAKVCDATNYLRLLSLGDQITPEKAHRAIQDAMASAFPDSVELDVYLEAEDSNGVLKDDVVIGVSTTFPFWSAFVTVAQRVVCDVDDHSLRWLITEPNMFEHYTKLIDPNAGWALRKLTKVKEEWFGQ